VTYYLFYPRLLFSDLLFTVFLFSDLIIIFFSSIVLYSCYIFSQHLWVLCCDVGASFPIYFQFILNLRALFCRCVPPPLFSPLGSLPATHCCAYCRFIKLFSLPMISYTFRNQAAIQLLAMPAVLPERSISIQNSFYF